MIKEYFIVFLSLFFPLFVGAQSTTEDKATDLMKSFNRYLLNEQLSDAFNLIKTEESKIKSKTSSDLVIINYLYSKYYLFIDDYDHGKLFAQKSYELSKSSHSKLLKAYGLYAMCYYYHQLDLTSMAYEYAQKIINTIDLEQHPYLASQVYYRLYSIHTNWDEAEETNIYAQKTIENAILSEDYDLLSNAYSAKAAAMEHLFKSNHNTAYQDSIQYFLRKSIHLDSEYPGQVGSRTNAINHVNVANYFFQQYRNQEISYDTANDSITKYISNAINISPTLDRNYEIRASVLGMKSQLALAKEDFDTAEKYLLTAYYNLREEDNQPAFYTLYNVTIGLYSLYEAKGDYKQAFDYLKVNQTYKDSLFNETKLKEVHSLEAKYENERIKEELVFLESESRLREIQNYLLLAVCLLILTTLYFIRKNYLRKIALQKAKAFSLEKKRAEAEAQINLEKEKQARLSAERKILKLENEKMQKEVIANSLQINRKNELLQEFRDKIKTLDNSIEVDKSLKKEKRLEKSLNETVKEFDDINPKFFKQLREYSDNKLTPLDLKYCAYFHLGLGTKDIAQIFNVEPKSIRMKKYRIKLKLNLPKDQSLEEFFEQI